MGAIGLSLMVAAAAHLIAANHTFVYPGFTEEVYGVADNVHFLPDLDILGGVAFAADGDPWISECRFSGAPLHRFDAQSTTSINGTSLHPHTTVTSATGCGLVNNPDGFIYSPTVDSSNISLGGIVRIDKNTGAAGAPLPNSLPGNALGIAVDPQRTDHLIYAGTDCHPTLDPLATTCTIHDYSLTTQTTVTFAQFLRPTQAGFVDGMYFDPSGRFLFMAAREPGFALVVLDRTTCTAGPTPTCNFLQVPMASEPDGVAFHAAPARFVVTNNTDGTMSRFDFPMDDYTVLPVETPFAVGVFRGDLMQVGPDGCIYATQNGTHYDNNTVTDENNVVRICEDNGPGFVPPVGGRPNVAITKTADATPVTAGLPIGFTIAVTSNGIGTATGVTVTDTLPANAGLSWTIDAESHPGSCSIATGVLTCNFGSMASGTTKSVHISSPTTRATAGTVVNTANVTTTNDGSGSSTATITVLAPNLSVTKTADATPVTEGSPIGFTITVSNGGPGTALNATLNDPLPAGSGINWSINPAYAGPGTCTITGSVGSQTLGCSFGDLTSGQSSTVHVTSPTATGSAGTYTNTATAQASNNPPVSSTATIVVNPGNQLPHLNITKTADASPVTTGTPIGFTIAVSNSGPGTAVNATLADPLPAGSGLNWSISPAYPGPGTCAITGSVGSQTLNCSFGNLASGAGATVHVTSPTTSSSAGTYTNTATAQASNNPPVQASASITVRCPVIQIIKTADATNIGFGTNAGFTIKVTNNGPGTATGVTVTDTLPANPRLHWTINGGTAAAQCSITAGVLTCNWGSMAAGTFKTVHITSPTYYETCGGTITNTARVQTSNAGSDQSTASIAVGCDPAVVFTKTAALTATPGSPLPYTISYTNAGPFPAANATIVDSLPASVTFVSASNGGIFDPVTRTVTWHLGTVPVGVPGSVGLVVVVPLTTPVGTVITNRAEFTADLTTATPAVAVTTVLWP